MKKIFTLILFIFAVVFSGCIYPFEPKNVKETENLLVVDGDIIANGTTIVKLSRSYKLSYPKEMDIPVERSARVVVESSTGEIYPAYETSPGCYEAATDGLDLSAQYRLHITTQDNMEYASQFVPVSISPPIDSLTWFLNLWEGCINIYVSTQDSTNKTLYYRWNYEQTWEFTSAYNAMITFNSETGEYEDFPDLINPYYYCWNEQNSSAILLGNSLNLSEDVIADKLLITIKSGDQRISYLYSVLVIQRALTAEGYVYWENLRKNGQDLGGIFAPMPSEVRGNIYCLSHPDQFVLGFVGATTLTYSRIFIERPFHFSQGVGDCENVTGIFPYNIANLRQLSRYYRPVFIVDPERLSAIWTQNRCADCTFTGTKNKPPWWPNDHI